MPPSPENNYQVGPTEAFSRAVWNAVLQSVAQRLAAREALEADFEALIEEGTQAALDLIQVNVGPQVASLAANVQALEEQLEDILGAGTAANSVLLGGQAPSFYLALANATGTLPVAQVSGVDTLIADAISALKSGVGTALDTLDELAAALGDDPNFATTIATAMAARLRFDAAQSLTTPQSTQALDNLGFTALGKVLAKADVAGAVAALGVRQAHIGEIITSQAVTPPPFCLWPNGQNVSRTTYALLFDATTISGMVALTNGSTSATLSLVDSEAVAQVQPGMPIEAAGIPAGVTIAARGAAAGATLAVTLSAAATATTASVSARVFPNGNGNGSTTFGVVDRRDRTGIGRGNMGGTAANRITVGSSGLNSSALGRGGGDQLTPQQNLSETYGVANSGGLNWMGQVPGDFLGGASNPAGSVASGGGAAQNIQPSVVDNEFIYAGA